MNTRYSALIIGILGGIAALVGTVFTLFSAGVGGTFGVANSNQALLLSIAAFAFAILGIAGAILALRRPFLAGILMIAAAIGGTLAVTGAFLIGGILLLIGGIFAFRAQPATVATPAPQGA